MRIIVLLYIVSGLIVPTSLTAQCFPDQPDNIGIYTASDPSGTPYVELPLGTHETLYLCLTNCSQSQVVGWEMSLRTETLEGMDDLPGISVNSVAPPNGALFVDALNSSEDYKIGLALPVFPDEHGTVVLMEIEIFAIYGGYLYLGLIPDPTLDGQMSYVSTGTSPLDYTPMYTSSGRFSRPVFSVNGPYIDPCGVVPTEQSSWGAIRRIYR